MLNLSWTSALMIAFVGFALTACDLKAKEEQAESEAAMAEAIAMEEKQAREEAEAAAKEAEMMRIAAEATHNQRLDLEKVEEASHTTGNRALVGCVDEAASTYERKKCQKKNTGISFNFTGTVRDIKSAKRLVLSLDADNYADVKFNDNIGDEVAVNDKLYFKGKVTFWGTGILLNHRITASEWNRAQ